MYPSVYWTVFLCAHLIHIKYTPPPPAHQERYGGLNVPVVDAKLQGRVLVSLRAALDLVTSFGTQLSTLHSYLQQVPTPSLSLTNTLFMHSVNYLISFCTCFSFAPNSHSAVKYIPLTQAQVHRFLLSIKRYMIMCVHMYMLYT